MDELIETVDIVRISGDETKNQQDVIIKETPLTLFVNNHELVTLLCLPQYQANLGVGFLFSEGFLSDKDDIESVNVNRNRGIVWVQLKNQLRINENFQKSRAVTSGCARGLTFYQLFEKWEGEFISTGMTISHNYIVDAVADLNQRSLLFRQTGGTHSALLYQQNEFLLEREDIGRHNAIDKIIGECILKRISGEDKIMMSSGRISSEILLKAARFKIPILVSRGAPTSASLKLAEEIGITLVGFARGKKMNVYCNSWRIQ
ncbi:MAG TPA: formate dehydrogenase accessory sulfurtransferase FdhD [bacterium]|nr:formate dehydrogenase accessory sulfurtransferase FdhD [bacterium]